MASCKGFRFVSWIHSLTSCTSIHKLLTSHKTAKITMLFDLNLVVMCVSFPHWHSIAFSIPSSWNKAIARSFACLTHYLTECRKWVRHSNRNSISPSKHELLCLFCYYINILITRRSRLNSYFRLLCHSFMALNWASDMSAADWLSQTNMKNYCNFSLAVIWLFSVLEILWSTLVHNYYNKWLSHRLYLNNNSNTFLGIVSFLLLRYLQQFQDLYTEEGRKSVKIYTYIPGQQQQVQLAAAANQLSSQATVNGTSQASTVTAVSSATNSSNQELKTAGKVAIPIPSASNTVTVIQGSNLTMAPHASVPGSTAVSQVPVIQASNLTNVRTYGQKLAMFQQRGTVVGSVSSSTSVPLSGTTKIATAGLSSSDLTSALFDLVTDLNKALSPVFCLSGGDG